MKRLLLVGTALALLAPALYAQAAPAAPAAPAPQAGADQPIPPPPPGPEGRSPGLRGPDGPDGPGRRGPPPPPPSRAAHFRLERGETAVDVKCADDEPMKACGDIALSLIDKLATIPAEAGK